MRSLLGSIKTGLEIDVKNHDFSGPSDDHDEVGLERQLSVSYLLSDEAPFNGYDWT